MPTQTQVIQSSDEALLDVFGPLLQFLVTPAQASEAFTLIRGIVPPGVAIPLHSHADPEVLFVLEGELDVLQYKGDSSHWIITKPGETVCIPGDVSQERTPDHRIRQRQVGGRRPEALESRSTSSAS